MPRQDGKVAIVTGGGRGIGYEVVRHMARLGAHVIIGTVWKNTTSPLTLWETELIEIDKSKFIKVNFEVSSYVNFHEQWV